MAEGISARAYAQHRARLGLYGGTPAAVSQAIKAGRLTEPAVEPDPKKPNRWLVDPELADQQWAESTSIPHYTGGPRPPSLDLEDPADPAEPAAPADPSEPGLPPVGKKRAGRKPNDQQKYDIELTTAKIKAERQLIALKKERGEVGVIKDMQDEAARIAFQVRDAMLALVDRLPPVLAPIADPIQIEQVLQKEIEDALRSLS
jgi:hypothetical protein